MNAIMNIKLNIIGINPMIQHMVLLIWISKKNKIDSGEHKMNTTAKSVLGTMPAISAAQAAPSTSSKTLANLLLAAGVAALVVGVDQLIDSWAESHVVAAWLALWAVAVLAIWVLRGLTRYLAQNLMTGLDAWSAHVARRRADERLWSMAQSDPRLMSELQVAMDRASEATSPARDLENLMTRRAARLVRDRMYYI
jgi:ABC-type multidrug transport system fused ATPase/permease subunit